MADNWALTDPDSGWNEKALVCRYHQNSELQSQWAYALIGKNLPTSTDRILDFGSGDGKVSALLSQLTYEGEVIGVDIADEMIAFAKQMYPYPNLTFLHSQEVNFSSKTVEGQFDKITSFCAFHLIPNPEETLKALGDVLKPQGKLIASWPVKGRKEFYLAVKEEMGSRGWSLPPPTKDSTKMRNPEEIPNVFEAAGFAVETLEITETTTRFSSEQRLIDWFIGTCAGQWEIPEADRQSYFTDLVKRYLEYAPDERQADGTVSFTLSRADLVAILK